MSSDEISRKTEKVTPYLAALRSTAYRSRGVIVPLYFAIVTFCLEYNV